MKKILIKVNKKAKNYRKLAYIKKMWLGRGANKKARRSTLRCARNIVFNNEKCNFCLSKIESILFLYDKQLSRGGYQTFSLCSEDCVNLQILRNKWNKKQNEQI